MYRFKNLLCVLTLSERDAGIINYTSMIARLSKADNIYFVIINEHLQVPEYAQLLYPEKLLKVSNNAVKKIQKDIVNILVSEIKAKVHYEVIEDHTLDNCLKAVIRKEIDLVLYAKDIHNDHSISFVTKLIRRVPCSILTLSQNKASIKNILVPVDFSSHSSNAIESALIFARSVDIKEITVLHVCEMPVIHHLIDMQYNDYKEEIRKNAEKEGGVFLDSYMNEEITLRIIYDTSGKIGNGIHNAIQKNNIDLIVMGARGRNSGASIFMGSVAETLISTEEIPILAVKEKGTGLSILESIFKL